MKLVSATTPITNGMCENCVYLGTVHSKTLSLHVDLVACIRNSTRQLCSVILPNRVDGRRYFSAYRDAINDTSYPDELKYLLRTITRRYDIYRSRQAYLDIKTGKVYDIIGEHSKDHVVINKSIMTKIQAKRMFVRRDKSKLGQLRKKHLTKGIR